MNPHKTESNNDSSLSGYGTHRPHIRTLLEKDGKKISENTVDGNGLWRGRGEVRILLEHAPVGVALFRVVRVSLRPSVNFQLLLN